MYISVPLMTHRLPFHRQNSFLTPEQKRGHSHSTYIATPFAMSCFSFLAKTVSLTPSQIPQYSLPIVHSLLKITPMHFIYISQQQPSQHSTWLSLNLPSSTLAASSGVVLSTKLASSIPKASISTKVRAESLSTTYFATPTLLLSYGKLHQAGRGSLASLTLMCLT